jgi:hypothetical protein
MIRCTVAAVADGGALVLDFGPGQPRGRLEIEDQAIAWVFESADLLIVMEERGIVVYAGDHEIPRKFLSMPAEILDDLRTNRVMARA